MAPSNRRVQVVRPVSNVTLSEQVANQIMDMITSGRWKPGEKLLSEADLCEAFRVSRPTLREALKSISFAGYVRMRAGEGTFVRDDLPSLLPRVRRDKLSNERNLSYIIETRYALESRTAVLCAQRASDEQLENLERLVAQMQQCIEKEGEEGFHEADVDFHAAIATASGNPLLREFMDLLREPVRHVMHALRRRGFKQSQAEHVKILEALKEHNPTKAQRAMQAHLRHTWRKASVNLGEP